MPSSKKNQQHKQRKPDKPEQQQQEQQQSQEVESQQQQDQQEPEIQQQEIDPAIPGPSKQKEGKEIQQEKVSVKEKTDLSSFFSNPIPGPSTSASKFDLEIFESASSCSLEDAIYNQLYFEDLKAKEQKKQQQSNSQQIKQSIPKAGSSRQKPEIDLDLPEEKGNLKENQERGIIASPIAIRFFESIAESHNQSERFLDSLEDEEEQRLIEMSVSRRLGAGGGSSSGNSNNEPEASTSRAAALREEIAAESEAVAPQNRVIELDDEDEDEGELEEDLSMAEDVDAARPNQRRNSPNALQPIVPPESACPSDDEDIDSEATTSRPASDPGGLVSKSSTASNNAGGSRCPVYVTRQTTDSPAFVALCSAAAQAQASSSGGSSSLNPIPSTSRGFMSSVTASALEKTPTAVQLAAERASRAGCTVHIVPTKPKEDSTTEEILQDHDLFGCTDDNYDEDSQDSSGFVSTAPSPVPNQQHSTSKSENNLTVPSASSSSPFVLPTKRKSASMEDDDEDENRTGEDQIDNSEMKKAKRATEEQETFVSAHVEPSPNVIVEEEEVVIGGNEEEVQHQQQQQQQQQSIEEEHNYLNPKERMRTNSSSSSSTSGRDANSESRQLIPDKDNPPTHLLNWVDQFGSWSNAERLLAIDQLISRCQPSQVRHMMAVIEPQFQRDFISLLPKELALYVLSFLAPKDLLRAAQTCRYWRILCEDNLLWREKCRESGLTQDLEDGAFSFRRRRSGSTFPPQSWSSFTSSQLYQNSRRSPDFPYSACKAYFMRQHNIEMNWRVRPIRQPKILKGHDDHVITCLQFGEEKIVSGSDDNTLKVWSALTGKCLLTLVGHTGGVWSSQMEGNTIVSGSTDRTLKVWNAENGACVHTLYGHTSTVRCMHLHKKRVVSGSRDATLRMWNIDTGECLHVLVGHVAAVRCVQYDGRLVVSGAYDYMVKVWNPEREECLHTLSGHTNRVYSLQFDGVHVVSGSLDTSIRVWDVETGACRHALMGHQSLTSGMELRNNILVSGNADSTVKVWDITTGQCLQTLSGPNKHQSAVTCLQFNSKFVITSSDDGTVKLWDVKTGDFIRDLVALDSGGSGGVVWRIRANPTKLVCAVGSRNGTEETKLLVLDFECGVETSTRPPLVYVNDEQQSEVPSLEEDENGSDVVVLEDEDVPGPSRAHVVVMDHVVGGQ